jgi:general secretion pathway protein E
MSSNILPAKPLPNHISAKSELPEHTLLSIRDRPFQFPEEAEDGMGVILLKGGRASLSHKGEVWLLHTNEFARTVHYHSYKATVAKNYRVVHSVSIESLLLRALNEGRISVVEDEADKSKTRMMEIYEQIVKVALDEKVSDIHIERRRDGAKIRMRKHGQMMDYSELGARDCTDLASVIHNVLAENKSVTFNERKYQSASINTTVSGVEVMLRYQSLPVYPDGFDVVLRLLPLGDDKEDFVDLDRLGYAPSQVRELIDIVGKPVGALVIAGTTGSGKSTTLKNLLMLVNSSRGFRCKIYTIEDPPEYRIPRVSQIPVVRNKDKDDLQKSPFYEPLIAAMRADPDILMIGEIRDSYTGDGLKKATQSGHQVLTTTHASSALGVVDRLMDFGIQPSVMGNPEFINGLVYQKLVPVLCPKCSLLFSDRLRSSTVGHQETALANRIQRVLGSDVGSIRIRGPGCDECSKMQVVGRSVCAEIIAPDFQMLKCFRTQKMIEAYEYWRSLSDRNPLSDNMRGKTALEHAITKVHKGLISPHDVEDVFGPIDGAERMLQQMREEKELAQQSLSPDVIAAFSQPVASASPPGPESPFTANLDSD